MEVFSSYTSELINKLKSGEVGILPTDTIYGLACCASNRQSVNRLYTIKKRHNKPGTIIAANIDQLVELGLKYRYLKAVSQFWPGPTSVIIPCGQQLKYIHLGLNSLAVRIPDKVALTRLLLQTGPLLTTSANNPNTPAVQDIKEAQVVFKEKVDFYVDGGDLSNNLASTIVRLIDDFVEVVRTGASHI